MNVLGHHATGQNSQIDTDIQTSQGIRKAHRVIISEEPLDPKPRTIVFLLIELKYSPDEVLLKARLKDNDNDQVMNRLYWEKYLHYAQASIKHFQNSTYHKKMNTIVSTLQTPQALNEGTYKY